MNTGHGAFPTVDFSLIMAPNVTVLKYYRINSEEDGREACAILHAVGPSKVCFIKLVKSFLY